MIVISWSIRISKKKTTADIFRLIDYLPYLSESSCYSILDFLFFHLSHFFTFFEYGGLIVLFRYIFISIFFLLDIFRLGDDPPIMDRSSIGAWIVRYRYWIDTGSIHRQMLRTISVETSAQLKRARQADRGF